MDFEVYTPSGSQAYTGNARYDIEHPGGGLLTVWTDAGGKIVYGPAGWYRLEERLSTASPEPKTTRSPGTGRTDGTTTGPTEAGPTEAGSAAADRRRADLVSD